MADSTIVFTAREVSAYYGARVAHLNQRGRQWRGMCPLHRGKRSSFSVNSETGCWYCFADCGRGGSLIDFEIILTGADFRTALAAVFAIMGRAMPTETRMTREEWRAVNDARERAQQERSEIPHFAEATTILVEDVLEQLDSCDRERRGLTQLIEDLRKDARAVYRDWREQHPAMAAALVDAGRRFDLRMQTKLLHFIEKMAQEDYRDAA